MTCVSEITCTVSSSKKWFFWPAFCALGAACKLGMSHEKAGEILVNHCMKLEIRL